MIEIRFHGRYGQPVAAFADRVARAALSAGKYVQVFDNFGAYRPGMPMQTTVRIAEDFIHMRSANASRPDVVVVLDNSLLAVTDVTKGVKPGGTVIAANLEQAARAGGPGVNWQLLSLEPGAGPEARQEKVLAALTQLGAVPEPASGLLKEN